MSALPTKRTRFPRLRRALLPEAVVELIARFGGWMSELIREDSGYSAEVRLRATLVNARLGFGFRELARGTVLARPGQIAIGRGVVFRNNVVVMPGAGTFSIGDGSHISHHVLMAAGGGISIGRDCAISSGVIFYSVTNKRAQVGQRLADLAPEKAPITIGDHVHVGANATILPGVVVGDYAVIGAGAVVTRDVAPGAIVVGVPARPVKEK